MRTVEWKKRNGTMACHCIYSVEEADRLKLEYLKDWREGEIGDWVLTDDGFVVQVLTASRDSRDRKIIGTCTMTTNAWSKNCKLDTRERESRYSINGKVRNDNPTHMTASLAFFCTLVANGHEPEMAYIKAFYEKNTGKKIPNTYVKRRTKVLMGSDIVKQKIAEEIGDQMDKLGITREWILRKFKSLIETGSNEAAVVSALNKLSSFQGMDGNAKQLPQLPQIPQEVLDRLAKATGYTPTVASNEEEIEPRLNHNGPIEEAKLEKEENDETLHTHVGGPSGPFDPDAELGTGS